MIQLKFVAQTILRCSTNDGQLIVQLWTKGSNFTIAKFEKFHNQGHNLLTTYIHNALPLAPKHDFDCHVATWRR